MPEDEPLVLGVAELEPELVPEEPDVVPDVPPVAPEELGVDDDELGVEDDEPVEPDVPPAALPLEPWPRLHSSRLIMPSLFLSRLSNDWLPDELPEAPLDELPSDELLDDELPPAADGDEDDDVPPCEDIDGEDWLLFCFDVSFAWAAPANATSEKAIIRDLTGFMNSPGFP